VLEWVWQGRAVDGAGRLANKRGHLKGAKAMKWMKWFYDMKIGNRLLVALIFGGSITALVGIVSISRLARVSDLSKASYEQETLGISYLKQANIDLIEVDRAAKNVMLSDTQDEREQYKAQADAYTGLVSDDLAKAKPLIHTDKSKEQLAQVEQAWKESRESTGQVVALAMRDPLSKKRESVELSFGAGRAKADATEDLMAQLASSKDDAAKESEQQTEKTFHTTRILLLALVSWGVLGSLVVGVFIARSISKPLGMISEIAKKIAHGEVEQKIEYRYGDEVGVLAEAFRGMVEAVNALTHDAFMLAEAAVEGKLAIRADASKHQGDYRKIVQGYFGRGDRADQYGGRLRGEDRQGNCPAEDLRELQRRLQRHQEQPQCLHRRPWRPGRSGFRLEENGGQRLQPSGRGQVRGSLRHCRRVRQWGEGSNRSLRRDGQERGAGRPPPAPRIPFDRAPVRG
jgi:HAMP domain-containing protein